MKTTTEPGSVWIPTKVQFFYKHLNGRYYVRTYAGGKEKWASLKTTLGVGKIGLILQTLENAKEGCDQLLYY